MHLIEQREPLVCEFLDLFEGEGLAAFHSAAVNCLASHDTPLLDVLHHSQVVFSLFAELTLFLCSCVLDEGGFHLYSVAIDTAIITPGCS